MEALDDLRPGRAEAEVLPAATELAASLAPKNGQVVGKIRTDMYRPVLEALGGPAFG